MKETAIDELHQCTRCELVVKDSEKLQIPCTETQGVMVHVCPKCKNDEFYAEEPFPNEKIKHWDDIGEELQSVVIHAHASKLNPQSKRDTLERLFRLGRPSVIFGPTYVRVSKKSVPVMELLIREYLG